MFELSVMMVVLFSWTFFFMAVNMYCVMKNLDEIKKKLDERGK